MQLFRLLSDGIPTILPDCPARRELARHVRDEWDVWPPIPWKSWVI